MIPPPIIIDSSFLVVDILESWPQDPCTRLVGVPNARPARQTGPTRAFKPVDDNELLSRMVTRINEIVLRVGPSHVQIAVEGVATADLLERRRREAHVHLAHGGVSAWDHGKLHPGSTFFEEMSARFREHGFMIRSEHGSCVGTMACIIDQMSPVLEHDDLATFHVFSQERDIEAVVAMCSRHELSLVNVHKALRSYQVNASPKQHHWTDSSDRVVLDILTEGGINGQRVGSLIQDLPGLPRMPGTYAASAMHEAYIMWREASEGQEERKKLVNHDSGYGVIARESLAELLACYIDIPGGEDDDRTASLDWSGPGWRSRHVTEHFPHGFDLACGQYLAAINRELMHLTGKQVDSDNIYVHGHAPSATDLLSYLVALPKGLDGCEVEQAGSASGHVHVNVSSWSPAMQMMAVTPRPRPHCSHLHHLSTSPQSSLHTNLHLGCVHMFPTSFTVWWDKYPVIPALNLEIFEAAYRASVVL